MPEVKLTDSSFDQEVLKADKPVLVDFWAEWCAPCKVQGPIIETVAKEYEGKVKVASLEVDQSPVSAQQYGILSIPTLILFKQGKPIWQATGVQSKDRISEELDKLFE